MPNPNPKIFKRSLLAATVLSLSGCVTVPEMKEVDLSPIGAGILTAGKATANVGIHAWDVSMYLLGFSEEIPTEDQEAVVASDEVGDTEEFLLDEFEEDMFDDELAFDDELNPVDFESAEANLDDVFDAPSEEEIAIFEETAELEEDPFLDPEFDEEGFMDVDDMSDFDEASNTKPVSKLKKREEIVAARTPLVPLDESVELERAELQNGAEFTHTVSANETLWDIAKKTTGDATNWHVLADVNNLNQNANVFEGQDLIIPAKMLKPGYVDAVNDNGIQIAGDRVLIDTQDLSTASESVELAAASPESGTERLVIPGADDMSSQAVKLNEGETLWDFAKRTTGDATNWKLIASHNNFTEKQAVQVWAGQRISVPESLAKPDLFIADATPPASIKKPDNPEVTEELLAAIDKANKSSVDVSSEMLAEASSLSNAPLFADETQPITIVEANFKDPSQKPIKIAADAADIESAAPQSINQIMVSGTYYPKAIYNDADFSSSLLMRVSPGTTLTVSKAMGNWFEVATDKGMGYVHQRDIK